MTLANLLSESQIIPEMAAKERWQAIRELVDCLVASGKIQSADEEEILESIRQREETMSTGIGFGIAIPHASSSKARLTSALWPRLRNSLTTKPSARNFPKPRTFQPSCRCLKIAPAVPDLEQSAPAELTTEDTESTEKGRTSVIPPRATS